MSRITGGARRRAWKLESSRKGPLARARLLRMARDVETRGARKVGFFALELVCEVRAKLRTVMPKEGGPAWWEN